MVQIQAPDGLPYTHAELIGFLSSVKDSIFVPGYSESIEGGSNGKINNH
jgi:hypothetical protein